MLQIVEDTFLYVQIIYANKLIVKEIIEGQGDILENAQYSLRGEA